MPSRDELTRAAEADEADAAKVTLTVAHGRITLGDIRKALRGMGYVVVPESAISPVRGPGPDK